MKLTLFPLTIFTIAFVMLSEVKVLILDQLTSQQIHAICHKRKENHLTILW
jgi:hypothetical protein